MLEQPLFVHIIYCKKKPNFFTFPSLQTKVEELTGRAMVAEKRHESDNKVDAAGAMPVSAREGVSSCMLLNINRGHHKKMSVITELLALIGYL